MVLSRLLNALEPDVERRIRIGCHLTLILLYAFGASDQFQKKRLFNAQLARNHPHQFRREFLFAVRQLCDDDWAAWDFQLVPFVVDGTRRRRAKAQFSSECLFQLLGLDRRQ